MMVSLAFLFSGCAERDAVELHRYCDSGRNGEFRIDYDAGKIDFGHQKFFDQSFAMNKCREDVSLRECFISVFSYASVASVKQGHCRDFVCASYGTRTVTVEEDSSAIFENDANGFAKFWFVDDEGVDEFKRC